MTSTPELTVGIDIGTSSVKAVAADADGNIVRRARIPHAFHIPTPNRFEHDADVAWHDGPLAALAALGDDIDPRGVSVAAMVPSLTAVGADGRAVGPGLLYGDERGGGGVGHPGESGELGRFLAWLVGECPDATAFLPAQAMANAALSGEGVISTTAAAACWPLFDFRGWNEPLVTAAGARVEQLPRLVPSGQPAGTVVGRPDCVLEGGTIDAMGEQLVAGADNDGDALVICGTTLITWCVNPTAPDVPGYFPIPHTAPGKFLIGGPSNAGGLFLNWAAGLLADGNDSPDVANLPVWVPYPRGERTPIDDPSRRAELRGLDLTHGPEAVRLAAYEAAGFVVRRTLGVSPEPPRRIVATGGGTRVRVWLEALAACTGLPVDVVAVPEGGALGAAFCARVAAGLDGQIADASRWAKYSEHIEPDPVWADAAAGRYERWLAIAG